MSDKEKILIAIIIALLTGVASYRIDDIDGKILRLEQRVNKIIENYKGET